MIDLQAGQRLPLNKLDLGEQLQVRVECALDGADIALFALSGGRLADERYMVFYNQPASPEGALRQTANDCFTLDLAALPTTIDEIYVTITHDQSPIAAATKLRVLIDNRVSFDVKSHLQAEKAVMALRFYRHQQEWRLAAIAQGFNGGLAALVTHFGGEVADEEAPSEPPPPPVPLSKVDLRKQKVGVTLQKLGIEQEKMRVFVVMDASGSMSSTYRQGLVQETLERLVPVAARLDTDGELEFFYYANNYAYCGAVNEHCMENFVGREMPQKRRIVHGVDCSKLGGGNNEPPVMREVLNKHKKERQPTPSLVLFITDGGIYSNREIEKIIRDSSNVDLFWQFVGLGNANYGSLTKLDTLSGRVVDNAGFFAVDDIGRISDEELYQRLLSELPLWLKAARQAGIIR